jgi:ATP-grasp domain/ATP-grasp N-terminal domain
VTDRLAVVYSPGATGVRELFELAEARGLRLTCVPGRELDDDAPARRVLAALGDVVDGSLPLDEVAARLRAANVQGVVTFSDDELVRTADLAHALSLPGLTPAVARTVRSKYRQRTALNRADVSAVDVVRIVPPEVPTQVNRISFPAVLKPDAGTASRDTLLVASREAVESTVRALEPGATTVLETLIRSEAPVRDGWLGDYVSVESVVARGSIAHAGVTDRLPLEPPFREQGHVVPSTLSDERRRRLVELAERAIVALGIDDAVVHTEIKLARPEEIIEVNARLGGYIDFLYRTSGVGRLLDAAVDVALGLEPTAFAPPSKVTVLWIVLPPVEAVRLSALPEVRALAKLPGVVYVERFRRPGDAVGWRSGTSGRVLEVWLEAPDHDEARRRLDRVREVAAGSVAFDRSPGAAAEQARLAAP